MLKKLLLFLFGVIFLSNASNSFAGQTITGAGATFPYPVYSAWAFQYYHAKGVRVNYQAIGSGAGIKQISSRLVDFGASDAPLTKEKQEKYKLLQFPAVIGGVVPIVNISGIKPGMVRLTGTVLAKIYLGEIKKWNNPQIANLNRNIDLPDANITVVHRSDGSGTTAIFTTYLSSVSSDWASKVGKGKAVKWPKGLGGKGNPGVANYVKRVKNSIGYVEIAYATENKLAYVQLRNRAGKFVKPSLSAFQAAAKYAKWDKTKGYYLWLVNEPGNKSWPIAGATFILLPKEKVQKDKNVVKFFDWSFKNGDKTAKRLLYVPLPQSLKNNIREYWKENGIY